MSERAKIVVVDDSVVIRGLLHKIIDGEPDMEVVGSAANGQLGVEKVAKLNPDLVVLDIEMPVMSGLEAVSEIRKSEPTLPIVMFSTLTLAGANSTLDALARGASDYATKPSNTHNVAEGIRSVRGELIGKIRALVSNGRKRSSVAPRPRAKRDGAAPQPSRPEPEAAKVTSKAPIDAVVLGCSTGGPAALENVLLSLAVPLPVPMFIVQHMPPKFTEALAERLNRKCASTILEGAAGMEAEPGHCYIAPGGYHMALTGSALGTVSLTMNQNPPVNSCRPSVDPLFSSAAKIYRQHLLGVMLTGMGADGLDGTRDVRANDCPMIVQDEATSVVWGMPGAVTDAGLATEILPLAQISTRITHLVKARGASKAQAVAAGNPA